jgi:PRTRC genetic system protein C
MKIETPTRAFSYNGQTLTDPGIHMTAQQVAAHYSSAHPELVNATIEGPNTKDGVETYRFVRAIGTKG